MEYKMEIKCGNAKEITKILENIGTKTVTITPITNYGTNIRRCFLKTRNVTRFSEQLKTRNKKHFKLSAKKRKYFRDYYKRTHKK